MTEGTGGSATAGDAAGGSSGGDPFGWRAHRAGVGAPPGAVATAVAFVRTLPGYASRIADEYAVELAERLARRVPDALREPLGRGIAILRARRRKAAGEAPGSAVIRAAGAVLWRRADGGADGGLEIAVIHRPRYDDWTLPKGKLEPGEDDLAAALREVAEETGQRARPGRELPEVRYTQVRRGVARPKTVRYWEMEALGGAFQPGDEVDGLRWLPPDAAAALLTHDHDRALVRRVAADPPSPGPDRSGSA